MNPAETSAIFGRNQKGPVPNRPEALGQICLLFSVALVVAINFRLAQSEEAGCIII